MPADGEPPSVRALAKSRVPARRPRGTRLVDGPRHRHVVQRAQFVPARDSGIDPLAFWEHSLGCALVCRHFARKVSFHDPSKAYLAGLLHDLGIVVNLWILPNEFRTAFECASKEGVPLHEAEQTMLGFTHCESGRLLAERWELAPDLTEVVALHHTPDQSLNHAGLVALVELGDLLCRMSGLNYGYVERREVNLLAGPSFALLSAQYQALKDFGSH